MYLPGLWAIPPVDRDESRFAQASRQMYESGDWVVPRIQDRPRLNKPPLIYWLQCAGIAVFGDRPGQYLNGNIWVFRVPSILAAIGSVLITWRLGMRIMAAQAACLGAALLAVCPMVVWDAHQARADQVLLLCTTGAMWALLVVFTSRESTERTSDTPHINGSLLFRVILFWLFLAAGILTKGPITPMVVGLTAIALCIATRRWRWLLRLQPLIGIVILAAAIAPWLLALVHRLAHPTAAFAAEMKLEPGATSGWASYAKIVFDETLGRSATAKEGHWGPPGYHLVLLVVLMWPGSLLTGLGLARAFRQAFRGCRHPPARRVVTGAVPRGALFLLAWIIPSWVIFELISTKLPHYTMPLYPALCLVSARAIFAAAARKLPGLRGQGTRIGFGIWLAVGAAMMLGVSALVVVAGRLDDAPLLGAGRSQYMLPAALVAIALFSAARLIARGLFVRAQLLALFAAVIWGMTSLQLILPSARRFWLSPRIVEAVGSEAHGDRLVNRSSFTEDSLVFLTRGAVTREGTEPSSGPQVLLLPSGQPHAPPLRLLETIRGWNYSTGREVSLDIVQRPAAEEPPP